MTKGEKGVALNMLPSLWDELWFLGLLYFWTTGHQFSGSILMLPDLSAPGVVLYEPQFSLVHYRYIFHVHKTHSEQRCLINFRLNK